MPKPDAAHLQTDKELAKLEKRIAKIYKEAADDLKSTIDDYFAKFAKRDAKQKALLEAGEITEQEYKQWRLAQMGRGERFKALQSRVAERYTEANETAVRYVNDATPGIYSLNRNYSAYTIEKVSGNVGFDLWDEQTVRRLIVDNPEVMPYYPPEKALKRGIDLAYGKKQISASVTSSILQGKSIPGIAKDLQTRMPEMNKASAIRTARTAVTGAQNAGRMDSYVAAEKIGIKLKKCWLATLDGRTRHSHAMLDGKVVEKDKKFENGCMFPGDPNGPAEEVYNCRCTLIAAVEGVDTSNAQRRVRNPETGKNELVSDMTYQEWAGWKEKAQVQKTAQELQSDQSYEIFMTAFDGTESPVEFWMNMNAEQIDAFKASGKKINELFEDIKKTQPQNATRKIVDEWKQASPGGKERFALSHDYSSQKMQFQKVKAKSDGWMADANINGIVSVREDGIDSWEFVVGHEAGHQLTNLFPELQKVVIENPGNLLGRFNTRVMKFDGVFGEYNPDEAWATCVSNYVRNPERFEEMYPDTYLAVDEFFKSSPSALDFVKKALEDYRRIFDI